MITRAFWSALNPFASRSSLTKGTIISSRNFAASILLEKCFLFTLSEKLSGKRNRGKLFSVLPPYISCIGRKLPSSLIEKVPVILLLSEAPEIVTQLLFFLASVLFPHGTSFSGVWSNVNYERFWYFILLNFANNFVQKEILYFFSSSFRYIDFCRSMSTTRITHSAK